MHNYIICGMQFGDEGKGTVTDFLSNRYKASLIVRYGGGSQASHTVVMPNRKKHKFSQLGSGMFCPQTKTYLSSNMIVNLDELFKEVNSFSNKANRVEEQIVSQVYISPECYVVTPYHKLMNQLRELSKGNHRRGSLGTGVSEARYMEYISQETSKGGRIYRRYGRLGVQIKDFLEAKEKDSVDELAKKYMALQAYMMDFYDAHKKEIEDNIPTFLRDKIEEDLYFLSMPTRYVQLAVSAYRNFVKNMDKYKSLCHTINDFECVHRDYIEGVQWQKSKTHAVESALDKYCVIYEGSQGVMIDKKYGIKPNTTELDTSINYALKFAKDTEDILKNNTKASFEVHNHKIGVARAYYARHGFGILPREDSFLEDHLEDKSEEYSFWNGAFRYGWFDAVLFRYAQKVNKINELWLTCIDMLNGLEEVKVCNSYLYTGLIDPKFASLFDYYFDNERNVIITNIRRNSSLLKGYLEHCTPIYISVHGWKYPILKSYTNDRFLEAHCQNYINLLSALTGVSITLVSYGPTREDKIFITRSQEK